MSDPFNLEAECLSSELRVSIFILLLMYPRLNVSQISKLLGRHKATISRHMQKLEDSGLVSSIEEDSGRFINPRYYWLNIEKIERFTPIYSIERKKINRDPSDLFTSIKFYIFLFTKALNLLMQHVEYLEAESLDLNADSTISFLDEHVLYGKINFHTLNFSDKKLEKFISLYEEFREKANKLCMVPDEPNGTDLKNARNTMLFMNTILPMRALLEEQIRQAKQKEEN